MESPLYVREEYVRVCLPMRHAAHESENDDGHREGLLHFTLEGLLPANQTLVVNPATRTATLFSYPSDSKPQIIAQHHFSPNGMRVLVPLLQAYPHYCPYEVLLASLSSLSLDDARRQMQDMWEIAIRPVRRAINSLKAGLRDFGFQVRSISSYGGRTRPSSSPFVPLHSYASISCGADHRTGKRENCRCAL